ncbi:MAG: hypothetical protein HC869_06735 [Rhodospirillales bacterium]|nr:hypothetical protein [Rhodospirillales bacterium]
MSFKFSFEVDPEGITVPYPPVTDEIRRNRGFVDLRNAPERASEIAEAAESPALHNLLVRCAKKGAPIFTIGCDLGSHQEHTNIAAHRREVAGGYIQFASIHYDRAEPQSYNAFANAIGKSVKSRTDRDHWKLDCIGKWVDFKFEGEPQGLRTSLWIWFFAASNKPLKTFQSRERLIEAIDAATDSPAAIEALADW